MKLKKENFANGRLVRNLVEKIKFEQAVRIKEKGSDDLYTIIPQDIKNVVDKIKTIENKRKLTLEEFKKYTVELFKNSIYDLQSIKNAIEEREEFYFDTNINISIQDIETLNLDNLYQVIAEVFEWIYIKKINLDDIERIEIIKKLEKLLEKYEKDV